MNREQEEKIWNRKVDPRSLSNEEQREAHQQEIDNARNAMMLRSSPEDQKKFLIVEKVMKELADANILSFLFAQLPDDRMRDGSCVCQFNTQSILLKKPKNTRQWKVGEFTFQFYESFANTMVRTTPSHYDQDYAQVAISTNLFQQKCAIAMNYLHFGKLPEEIQKIKDLAEKEQNESK